MRIIHRLVDTSRAEALYSGDPAMDEDGDRIFATYCETTYALCRVYRQKFPDSPGMEIFSKVAGGGNVTQSNEINIYVNSPEEAKEASDLYINDSLYSGARAAGYKEIG